MSYLATLSLRPYGLVSLESQKFLRFRRLGITMSSRNFGAWGGSKNSQVILVAAVTQLDPPILGGHRGKTFQFGSRFQLTIPKRAQRFARSVLGCPGQEVRING